VAQAPLGLPGTDVPGELVDRPGPGDRRFPPGDDDRAGRRPERRQYVCARQDWSTDIRSMTVTEPVVVQGRVFNNGRHPLDGHSVDAFATGTGELGRAALFNVPGDDSTIPFEVPRRMTART
jgi:hypothetical protein